MTQKIIVFLPALMCTEMLYYNQITFFNKKKYNFISLYNSTLSSIQNIATEIVSKLTPLVLNNNKLYLAGTSMGGYIAMYMAFNNLIKLDGLILINTTIFPDNELKKQNRTNIINNTLKQTDTDFINKINLIDNILPSYLHTFNLQKFNIIKNMYLQIGRIGLVNQQTAILNRPNFINDSLNNFNIPTLIISADKDLLTTTQEHIKMHKLLNNSTIKVIKKSGHLSPLDKPNTVNNLIHTWINK